MRKIFYEFLILLIIQLLNEWTDGKKVSASFSAWEQSSSYNLFASDLYNAIGESNLNDNVIISPAAVQCSMALAYYGAKGETSNEIGRGLRFDTTNNAEEIVQRFSKFQLSFTKDFIRLFNRIYINENLEFKGKFKEIAENRFNSGIEKADFHPPYNKRTADRINRDIELKMNGKVKDLIQAQQLDDLTEGIIVNAITFDGQWQKAFHPERTEKRLFANNGERNAKVDFMWALNNYAYGELGNLNAKVLELPYQNNDYSMIIILPNRRDGLKDLQQKLKGQDLVELVKAALMPQKVEVLLPKFAITYGTSLEEPFKKLGVVSMFKRDGDFGNMYRMFVSHYINSANHKAHIEVTENGKESPLEGNAAVGLKMFAMHKKFDANHPFIFAIKYQNAIIFMGHIVHL